MNSPLCVLYFSFLGPATDTPLNISLHPLHLSPILQSIHNLDPSIPIDVCATALAGLDKRAYRRSILRDANGILEGILLPMSFPWEHQVAPTTKNLPCDIDEMPFVFSEDELYNPFENGPLGYGRFDVGQCRYGPSSGRTFNPEDVVRSASRRSDETGVVELRTMTLPPSSREFALAEKQEFSQYEMKSASEDIDTPGDSEMTSIATQGEISLRCFEQVQSRKRRKLWQSKEFTKTQHVSVRVGSSSSRSSIFPCSTRHGAESVEKPCVMFLPATLPVEVQTGRLIRAANARAVGEGLGSYNCRHGLGLTNLSGKNSNRVAVGRTRLIWTEKSPSDLPQRVFFTSLLTSERIESGVQKRPREIQVTVKFNGSLVRFREYPASSPSSSSSAKKSATRKDGVHYSDIAIERALMTKRNEPRSYSRNLQCTLDTEELVNTILKDSTRTQSSNDGRSYACSSLEFIPPRIDCLPDINGLINVVCSMPGKIRHPSAVHDFLQNGARSNNGVKCSVCWSSRQKGRARIEECSSCGITVHTGCCLDHGKRIKIPSIGSENDKEENNQWRCAVCCRLEKNQFVESASEGSDKPINGRPKRISRPPQKLVDSPLLSPVTTNFLNAPPSLPQLDFKCALCPHLGGAISPFEAGGKMLWIHEVCRIWSFGGRLKDSASEFKPAATAAATSEALKDDRCALCGAIDGNTTHGALASGLVKCAAARCRIQFHPMCARLASLYSETAAPKISDAKCVDDESTAVLAPDVVALAKTNDIRLCTQYTLTAMKCVAVTGSYGGKDPGVERVTSVPIAFCGMHNPKRDRDFHGMYPGGRHLDESTLRIPPHDGKD
jgi:hypothetical protein